MKPRALFPSSDPSVTPASESLASVATYEPPPILSDSESNSEAENLEIPSNNNWGARAVTTIRGAIEQLENSSELVSALQLKAKI